MRSRRLSYSFAALLWLATVFELALIPIRAFQGALPEVPVFGRLLTQPEWADRLPPIVILAVLAWVLIEVLLHMAGYAGFPACWEALGIAKEVFESRQGSD